jgi:tetratricopeptide (TPR) repeat protein
VDRLREGEKVKIARSITGILTLLLIVSGTIPVLAEQQDDPAAILDEARKLTDQKLYDQALEKYASIKDRLLKDAGLLIEWGRVHTYADYHPEAIKIFVQVIRDFPQRAKEIYRELGDQYKWNGQWGLSIQAYLKALENQPGDTDLLLGLAQAYSWNGQKRKALLEYNNILKNHPQNLNAMNDKAEVLSWMDRLETSNRLYAEVLSQEPGSVKAMIGQARILVWKGFHRRGIKRYQDILARYPQNEDALEGLAFAQHWNGQDTAAAKTIQRLLKINPKRKEASKLYFDIRNSQKPFVNNFNHYSQDKNDLTVVNLGLRSGFHVGYNISIEGILSWQEYRKPLRQDIHNTKPGLGMNMRISKIFELNSFLFANDFREAGFKTITTNTWFTVKPDDIWRFDLSYDHETFEDVDALVNRITTDNAGISFDLRPNRFWFLSGRYRHSFYSDKNRQSTVFAKLEYRLIQKPFFKTYYNFYYSDWKFQFDNGYFNPKSIVSHSLGLYSGVSLTHNLFVEAQASVGHEVQKPNANRPTYYAGGSINYRLSENWLVFLHGEYFDARSDAYSNGYFRKYIALGITYNFGSGHIEIREASRPSRTTISQ